jgi:hypothetical protein
MGTVVGSEPDTTVEYDQYDAHCTFPDSDSGQLRV